MRNHKLFEGVSQSCCNLARLINLGSLSDAKTAEDLIKDIFGGGHANNLAE